MTAPPRAVLLDLGRTTATGARRRLDSLNRVVTEIGYETTSLHLLPEFRSTPMDTLRRIPQVFGSSTVPETLAWSPSAVRAHLDELAPDLVICVTTRCFDPALVGPWRLYLDYVDRLSVSYRDRAELEPNRWKRLRYRLLAGPQRRAERSTPMGAAGSFAAGVADARALGAQCLAITVDAILGDRSRAANQMDVDVAFVGTLDYPPNIEAIEALDQLWPKLCRARPSTTVLVAGARPTAATSAMAARNGWELLADFDSTDEVYRRCRVAVAPLRHASGIQIKVLDAAAAAVPQIVSPVVADGLDADFPFIVCTSPTEWVDTIVDLLDDPASARRLGERSRTHVVGEYSVESVARRVGPMLSAPPTP